MPVYRIAVSPTHPVSDDRYVRAAEQLHLEGLEACYPARLFFLEGDFSPAEVERISRELLTDPVTETFSEGVEPLPPDTCSIETTFLPGVTDPVAENLCRSAHLLGVTALERAATGQSYHLHGKLSPETLHRLATEVFSNPVIQRTVINQPITPPFVPVQANDDTVEIIPIRNKDAVALLAISRERRLSLDLNEMLAIRDYYEEIERDPTDAELEMLAQTWSEHCVHKTFKANIVYAGPVHGAAADSPPVEQHISGLLKTYIRAATEKVNKPWVYSAFVDNAGIIKFDDQWDIAFKVETHNRPSALEPFGGANTGVGGVIRDVLGVSARPIANTDVLCFGLPDMPREALPEGVLHPRRIADGVIAGIEDYGNKMGIPTVNGAIVYHPGYTSNPLVFCGCLGILPHGSHRSKAEAGDLIVVIGGRTGRDGLRGATFSSMEMDTTTAAVSGGAVQIGHPIQEKQVQEVVLRARDEGLYTAITDCGAGGLSSAVGEMGAEIGAKVQLESVPLKYPGLRPWEIWLSEAQERMVLAVPQRHWMQLQHICNGQDVECVSIGTFEPTGKLELYYGDKQVGALSMGFLHDGIPTRNLKAVWEYPSPPAPLPQGEMGENGVLRDFNSAPTQAINFTSTLLKLLALPTIRSKEDVIRKYDHEVQTGTAVKPLVGVDAAGPGDAAVLVPLDTMLPLTPKSPLPQGERGLTISANSEATSNGDAFDRLNVPPYLHKAMTEIARHLRRESTPSEGILWEALRQRRLEGRKFRRQQAVGAFILDFYCSKERLAVEVDGSIHDFQREADAQRQEILESLGIRFVRVTASQVEQDLERVLATIRTQFQKADASIELTPSPLVGEGAGGEGSTRALALANGICPLYNEFDPYAMAWAAVDEAMRNLVAVGADPDQVAILDNFCWGNTQLPDRLGALVRCSQGCYDAAVAYNVPYISGKDSLNNEYLGEDGQRHAIPGTLLISAVGIVPDVNKTVTMDLKAAGNLLYLIGDTRDEFGGSHFNLVNNSSGGVVPQPVPNALDTMRTLHQAIQNGWVKACHDLSEGGFAVALAEMCIGGRLGAEVSVLQEEAKTLLFAESSCRFIVEVALEDTQAFNDLFDGISHIGRVTYKPRFVVRRDGGTSNEDPIIQAQLNELEMAWRGTLGNQHPTSPTIHDLKRETRLVETVSVRTTPPRVLILHANGTNRDRDAVLACQLAGGEPEIVHVNQLFSGERELLDYQMLVIPGGFSYGDDLGAGVLWGMDLRQRLTDLDRFVSEGRPVLGICNGFQTLVKAGLLPGSDSQGGGKRKVTLTYNQQGHFECRWVYLQPNPDSSCLFTDGLHDLIHCPVAHGEGRIATANDETLNRLLLENLHALTYVDSEGNPAGYPFNPNGSAANIAGLCNPQGNIFGLMPHPENHIFPWQNPRKHRGASGMMGLRLFENGIKRS